MLLEIRMPLIVPQMTGAKAECVYVAPGDAVAMGTKLVDFSIDLSSAFAQECPPVSYYRIVARERAILRRLEIAPGLTSEVDQLIGLFTTDPDEPLDGPAERGLRVAVAGIMHHDGMLTGQVL